MQPRTLVVLCALVGSHLFAQNFALDTSFGADGVAYQPGPAPYKGGAIFAMETLPDGGFLSLHMAGVDAIKVMRCSPNGEPDGSFANNGHFIFAPPSVTLIPSGFARRDDGKIIITATGIIQGTNDPKIFLCQLLPNGEPDPSFGVNGVMYHHVPVYQTLRDVVLQPDGKILVAGGSSGSMFAGRFLLNGALDTSFGINGIGTFNPPGISASANSIALGPDGSIFLGGHKTIGADATAWIIAKLDPNGVLDPSFGNDGIFFMDHEPDVFAMSNRSECIWDLLVLDDGSVIAGGHVAPSDSWSERMAVMKLDPSGTPVAEFGENGRILAGTDPEDRYFGKILIMDPTGLFLMVGSVLRPNVPIQVALLAFDGIGNILDQNGSNSPFRFQPAVPMALTPCGTLDHQGRLIVALGHWNYPQGRSSFVAFDLDLNVGAPGSTSQAIGMAVWPNPSSGQVVISYALSSGSEVFIDLLDTRGRMVDTQLAPVRRSAGSHVENLSLDPRLSNGPYLLRLRNNSGSWSRPIVIQR
ncbi:MAG: T9SS type A sorting domain-containing protein [Flavobacteriales bacterium]